jgi:pyrroloquinoline quinone (PQQ) biosynthesis protein C
VTLPATLPATTRDAFFAEVVDQLARQAVQHRAVQHPYLRALGDGTLPDLRWAVVDFADHYYGYSAHFPRYLTTVISRLEEPEHRAALLRNLTEESGSYEEHELRELATHGIEREWIEGVPHPALFHRFCQAVGARRSQSDGTADQVVVWREMLLSVLGHGSPAEAVGALGLGTEGIVREIYAPITRAIQRLELAPRDTVFFPLHTVVDDEHRATLLSIATSYARRGHPDLRRGMLKALQLRSAFWDWLHARALDPARAQEVL